MKKASIILLLCLNLSGCTLGVGAWSTPEEIKEWQAKHKDDVKLDNGMVAAIPLGF